MSAADQSKLKPGHQDPETVLIVEDEADYRWLLDRWARQLGLNTVEARNCEEARGEMGARKFDLLLLDINLPEPSGFELLELLKSLERLTPAVVLAENVTQSTEIEALRLNAFACVEKRLISSEFFRLTMERALEHGRLLRENERLRIKGQELIVRDPVTDLHNHRHLESVLQVELDRVRRYGRELSTVMIDVVDFESYYHRHGRAAGDRALLQLAQVIKEGIRAPDVPIRVGDDEFIILLPETSIEEAAIVADRIADQSRRILIAGDPLQLSVGISEWGTGT